MRNKIIAVDFDGTLCTNCWPDIGKKIDGVFDYCLAEQDKGAKLILWTCRTGRELECAVDWCNENGLYFDAINENLPEVKFSFQGESRKIFADEYIDDKAVLCLSLHPVIFKDTWEDLADGKSK